MMRNVFECRVKLLPLAIVAASFVATFVDAGERFVYRRENVLGTSLLVIVRADAGESADLAETAVLAEIDRVAGLVSTYDPASEFSRWRSGPRTPVPVSPELFEVLRLSDHWRQASRGAFDARVQSIILTWKAAARQGRVPAFDELERAIQVSAQPAWKLDERAQTAESLSESPLTFDALAKGFIVDCAAAAALRAAPGLEGILVAIGGDLCVRGDVEEPVRITDPFADADNAPPSARVVLRNRALATSGGYRRGLRIGGNWYSHLIDPRSGLPVAHVASATAIADRVVDADALATIFAVLPVEESLRLADETPGVACLLVTSDGKTIESSRWKEFGASAPTILALADETERQPIALAFAQAPAGAATAPPESPKKEVPAADTEKWPRDAEFFVQFELFRPEANRRSWKWPYVAIWIENPEGYPVRTLAVWWQVASKGERWLPELRRWTRSDRLRRQKDDTDLLEAVSGATRTSGKYKLAWDGKDDDGKLVSNGKYTLLIESSREHGPYSLIRQEIELTGKPFTIEPKENSEITGVSLEYRRKPAPAK